MAKQSIVVPIIAGFSGDGLKKAQTQLSNLGDSVNKLTTNALKAGAGLAITKAWQGFTTVAESAITGARDLERNLAAVDTVFGSLAPKINEFNKGAYDIGLSQAEAAKASVFLGSVLKQSGFTIDETANQTERLVSLAADLALTYGYDVQEAMLGMTALFRGEYDPIEKFGVAMKQNEINAELAARKLNHLEGAERRLAEQQIRLQFLFERSADAQGAFARQSGTLAVEQERLQASIQNMTQNAGTPLIGVLAEMSEQLVPVVEELTPTLTSIFEDLAEKTKVLLSDTDGLKDAIIETSKAIAEIIQLGTSMALFLGQNAVLIKNLILGFLAFKGVSKLVYTVNAALVQQAAAAAAATTATKALNVAMKANLFGAIAGLVVALVTALYDYREARGLVDSAESKSNDTQQQKIARLRKLRDEEETLLEMMKTASEFQLEVYRPELARTREELRKLEAQVGNVNTEMAGFEASGLAHLNQLKQTITPNVEVDTSGDGSIPDVGGAAKDYVAEFYAGLEEEIAKQAARVKLQTMGASEGLISSILSGAGWEEVFKTIVDKGISEVGRLQEAFSTTADGIKELADALKAELEAIDEAYAEDIQNQKQLITDLETAHTAAASAVTASGQAFADFFETFSVLPTTEREIGRFEAQSISSLEAIEGQLKSTLASLGEDFRESYNYLLDYARKEFATLAQIQRQRDELAKKRSLAEALIGDVKSATVGAANITSLFSKAQSAAGKLKATDVIAETIEAGRDLKEFRVTIMRDVVEPMATAGSVIDGFRDIVAKTRLFIDNLKTLRELGLDPQLFNQLVEAGVEAGGETAQALVDGGSESITELNGLFGELNALGAELGEETAQVMYGAGVDLTNGIIEGIAAEQAALEEQATILADAFELVFTTQLEAAMDSVLAAIKARVDEAKAELNRILAEMEAAKAAARSSYPSSAGGSGGSTVTDPVVPAVEEVAEVVEKVAESVSDVAEEVAKNTTKVVDSSGITQSGLKHVEELTSQFTPTRTDTSGISQAGMSHLAGLQSMPTSNTFNISVNANSRTQGTQAGEAVVSSLQKYISVSGNTTVTRLLK